MTKKTIRALAFVLTPIITFSITYSAAFAHGDEAAPVPVQSTINVEQMKELITILTQMIDVLKVAVERSEKISVNVTESHDETATASHDEAESDELKVWVEVHSYKTHAHIQKPNEVAESFIVEGVEYTDEAKVIEAIAKKTGLAVHDIEEVITFPTGELNEKGDSVSEPSEDAEQDVAGIHIMNNGKIMWGNSTEVQGATITSDGKVKLANGQIITPAFDLR